MNLERRILEECVRRAVEGVEPLTLGELDKFLEQPRPFLLTFLRHLDNMQRIEIRTERVKRGPVWLTILHLHPGPNLTDRLNSLRWSDAVDATHKGAA